MDPHVDDGPLNALLDGELDAAERRAVESHLALCAECRARYDEARRFLAQASDLLGYLDAPAAQAAVPAAPAAPPPEVRRVAPTAKEPAVDLPGPGVARTGKEPAVDPAARVARTAKEKAVDPDANPFSPTAEVPALPPELPTQQSPSVRPIFAQAQRGESAAEGRRRWGVPPLAWAAMLIVGVGAGWMANEALHPARPALDVASAPPPVAAESSSRQEPAPPPVATTAPATRAPASRPLVKPRPMRGAKPPSSDQAAARIPRDRPPGVASRPDELASRSADAVAGPPAAGTGAGGRSNLPSGAMGGVAAPAPAAAAPPEGAPLARRAAPAAATARAAEAAATTFQRITMDDAVRRLSGSIRLIDGLQPGSVEVGPGRLVPGAAPDREVIRVHYMDETGRPLVLDQQPGDTPSATSVNGLMRGDTLVTAQPDGGVRVRWVDRKSFWLSLTGAGGPDTVRVLVERIR